MPVVYADHGCSRGKTVAVDVGGVSGILIKSVLQHVDLDSGVFSVNYLVGVISFGNDAVTQNGINSLLLSRCAGVTIYARHANAPCAHGRVYGRNYS